MRLTDKDGDLTGPAMAATGVAAVAALTLSLFALSSVVPENGWAEKSALKRAREAEVHRRMMVEDAAAKLARW